MPQVSRSMHEVIARVGHSFVWEPKDKRLFVFGGLGSALRPGPDPALRSDLWALNVTDALLSAQSPGKLPTWVPIRLPRNIQQLSPRCAHCIWTCVDVHAFTDRRTSMYEYVL